MRECYDCRENDRSYSLSLYYKCTNECCFNYIQPKLIKQNKKLIQPKIYNYFRRTI